MQALKHPSADAMTQSVCIICSEAAEAYGTLALNNFKNVIYIARDN